MHVGSGTWPSGRLWKRMAAEDIKHTNRDRREMTVWSNLGKKNRRHAKKEAAVLTEVLTVRLWKFRESLTSDRFSVLSFQLSEHAECHINQNHHARRLLCTHNAAFIPD